VPESKVRLRGISQLDCDESQRRYRVPTCALRRNIRVHRVYIRHPWGCLIPTSPTSLPGPICADTELCLRKENRASLGVQNRDHERQSEFDQMDHPDDATAQVAAIAALVKLL